MLRRLAAALLLCATATFAQNVKIPDTPAGRALASWLRAFNSGDMAQFDAFIKQYYPSETAGGMMGFHNQTGGFDLLSVDISEPLVVKFHLREKNSFTIALGSLSIRNASTGQVENIGLRALPPGTAEDDITLDTAEREQVIQGAIEQLKDYYVYADVAQKMAGAVLAHDKARDYDNITDGNTFAARLTDDMQAVSHDKHLRVNYSPFRLSDNIDGGPTSEEQAQFRKDVEQENCGWEKLEILPDNIGYVKFNVFAPPGWCGSTVVAAMNFLSHVDAVIFDLRDNTGGDPRMVDMVVSYLFDGTTHIDDFYFRNGDKTRQFWTLPYVPGPRLTHQPVYILTSSRTFSGGEEFCYDLKTLQRATIIGETTGGGAHPVSAHRIDDHFMIGIPEGRPINPITHQDWEGTGVTPDVPVKADDALATAQKMATQRLHEAKEKQLSGLQ
jgi:retinol-binding protein 3